MHIVHLLHAGPYSKHCIGIDSFNPQPSYEADTIAAILIFADDETEHREAEKFAQGPTVWKWQTWALGPGQAVSKAFFYEWVYIYLCYPRLPIKLCFWKSHGLKM